MKINTFSIFLLAIILFQSCVIYQKSSVSLSEAYDKGKVKIEKRQGLPAYYKNLLFEEGNYYGIYENKKVEIDTAIIANIYLKDVKKSKRTTIIIFGVVIPLVFAFALFMHAIRSFGG